MSRAEEAARRAELAAARTRRVGQAQVLIDAFVAEARRRGIAPEPLRATLYTASR